MNYSYVLLREQDGRFYIGSTGDLRARLQKHSSAQCVPPLIAGPCV
jgi:predicted GIY-YIG superfamily endonuclease